MRGMRIFALVAAFPVVLGSVGFTAEWRFPPLRTQAHAGLQVRLDKAIRKLGLEKAVQKKQLSVALVDLYDLQRPLVASVNGDDMFYAASLPKIAILLGAFAQIEEGKLQLDSELEDSLTRMIRYSSNTAATDMLHKVGKPYLAKLLQSDRFRLYDKNYNGGLWCGKDYAKAAAWKRDPLYNLSHGATALQTARFYYLLETQQLLSRPLCKKMKEILGQPGIRHKFVAGLEAHRPGSRIYRKSGSWRQYHADSAIVERGDVRYIAVALANDEKGGQWLKDLIVSLDDVIVQERGVTWAGSPVPAVDGETR